MNKKWTPHIIAAGAFAVFIVLGLACASAPKSPPLVIPLPTLSELREKNGEDNKLVVIYNQSSAYVGGSTPRVPLNGRIVIDRASISTMRSYQQDMKALSSEDRANWAGSLFHRLRDNGVYIESYYKYFYSSYKPERDYPSADIAAFSLGNNVSEIGIFLYAEEHVGGGYQPLIFYNFLYIPISNKKEQFFLITDSGFSEIVRESTVNGWLSQGLPHSYVYSNDKVKELISIPLPASTD
jgi:hypothetical protein